ncbi:GNAT family N-acetyltransferase [Roseovarius albus]|nr:GNAT family N-acetyltransferase [Roseovarius albus]
MAALLNELINIGDTTAFTNQVTRETLTRWLAFHPEDSAWNVAEDDSGNLLGFQSIQPRNNLPPESCDIGTFVKPQSTGLGIGSKLFEASRKAAAQLGYHWINATIRTDNMAGLAYYQSRGFEDYAHHTAERLDNGMIVDKVSKRFKL